MGGGGLLSGWLLSGEGGLCRASQDLTPKSKIHQQNQSHSRTVTCTSKLSSKETSMVDTCISIDKEAAW